MKVKHQNWHWDLNMPFEKIQSILSREDDPRFPSIAGTMLARVQDTKQVFDLITPASFCRRFRAIENVITSDAWTKERAAFWRATYLRLSKELHEKGIKIRKAEALALDDVDHSIIAAIKQGRKVSAMSQKELAQFMGMSQQYISAIERGREKVTVEFFKKFEKATGRRVLPILGIQNIGRSAKFTVQNLKEEGGIFTEAKGSITSDDPSFVRRMDAIGSMLKKHIAFDPDSIHRFLLVLHRDQSAHLYMNDWPPLNIVPRGGDVTVHFEGVEIEKSDNIIFYFKAGWKFGLYFDLQRVNNPKSLLDKDALSREIGALYQKLISWYVEQRLRE